MSKVKEQYMREKEKEFELEWSYQEWLFENVHEPSESELEKMEQEFLKKKAYFICSAGGNCIITNRPLNNTDFSPIGEQL